VPGPEVLRPAPTPAHPNPENPDPEGKVLVFVDVKRSMESGIKFYRSKVSGRIILSPGNEHGVIPPDCFRRAQKIAIVRTVTFKMGDSGGELKAAEKLARSKEKDTQMKKRKQVQEPKVPSRPPDGPRIPRSSSTRHPRAQESKALESNPSSRGREEESRPSSPHRDLDST
jgi:hypothetical protein